MTRDDDPDNRKTRDERAASRIATKPMPTVGGAPAADDPFAPTVDAPAYEDPLAKTFARRTAPDAPPPSGEKLAAALANASSGDSLATTTGRPALANASSDDDSLATTTARPALPREAQMFDVATTTELPALPRDLSATGVEAFPAGAKQIDMLASISPETAAAAEHVRNEALGRGPGSTHVEQFPMGAQQIDPLASISPENAAAARHARDNALGGAIDPLASISPENAAAARHVRDQALSAAFSATDVDALPEGAKQIDPLASISPENAAAARQVRDQALEAVRRVTGINALPAEVVDPNESISPENEALARKIRDQALERDHIDINATIVSKRASTAAEHVRDAAFEKLRDGTADDLRETIARPRRASDAPLGERRSDLIAASEVRTGRLAAVERPSDSMVSQRPSVGMRASEGPRPKRASEGPSASARPSNARTIAEDLGDAAPPLDNEDLALIARVRALPTEGQEPDWRVMEASIRDQVRDKPTYLPWWRRWQYLVPLGALAATAAIAFIVVKIARREPDRTSLLTAPRDAGTETQPVERDDTQGANTMWLDGEPFELDDIEPEALDEIAPALDGANDVNEVDDSADDNAVTEEVGEAVDDAGDGILPMTDYGWIDGLDDGEVELAESWLARKRS